jgi:hypothetical protein
VFPKLKVTEDQIKDTLRLMARRPVNKRTIPMGTCRANTAQRNVISVTKLRPLPLRIGNYYFIKADLLDYMIKHFDKHPVSLQD